MLNKEKVRGFFPEAPKHDRFLTQCFTRDAIADIALDYVDHLLGKEPSAMAYLDYARRCLAAAETVEKWLENKKSAADINKIFKNNETVSKSVFLSCATDDDINKKLTLIFAISELSETVDEYFIQCLRNIFNDPEKKYYVEYNDFCWTGKTILSADALRQCSIILLNRLEDYYLDIK
jgi:hypothetical protein